MSDNPEDKGGVRPGGIPLSYEDIKYCIHKAKYRFGMDKERIWKMLEDWFKIWAPGSERELFEEYYNQADHIPPGEEMT